MRDTIPVAAPVLRGNEAEYVTDCIESTWISSKGDYIDVFEDKFADFCQTKHAVSCSNGTVALHLALEAFGVGDGDEVVVPDLTFISTANAAKYCGATPVFVDVDPDTWTLDPDNLEAVMTENTAAIIPVHLYGHPVDMDPVIKIADAYDAVVIEDAAEAHGAEYKNQRVGSIGDAATFSFYGNKIVTTGEGGMVVTDNDLINERLRRLKDLCMDPGKRYWFPEIGYNYRMTNIQAAIGCAQMEDIDWHLHRRREIAEWYDSYLNGVNVAMTPVEREWAEHAYWMYSIVLEDTLSRDAVMSKLESRGIETRPFFYPMTSMPPYKDTNCNTPTSATLAKSGINLPTWAGLSKNDIKYVCQELINCFQ